MAMITRMHYTFISRKISLLHILHGSFKYYFNHILNLKRVIWKCYLSSMCRNVFFYSNLSDLSWRKGIHKQRFTNIVRLKPGFHSRVSLVADEISPTKKVQMLFFAPRNLSTNYCPGK